MLVWLNNNLTKIEIETVHHVFIKCQGENKKFELFLHFLPSRWVAFKNETKYSKFPSKINLPFLFLALELITTNSRH